MTSGPGNSITDALHAASTLLNLGGVRTTVRLDDDVIAAAERIRRERHVGLSEAVNLLARAGMQRAAAPTESFRQRTAEPGLRIDISNVGVALEILDDICDVS